MLIGGVITMYDKNYYRTAFNDMKKYVKLSAFSEEIGISRTTLSMFMKSSSYDHYLSLNKCDNLYNHIRSYFN